MDARINARMAALVPADGRAIDVGCGFGSLAAFLRDRGIDAIGVDMLAEFIEVASARYPGIAFFHQRSERLPVEAEGRDTVLLKDTLHHLVAETDFHAVCAEFVRVGVRRIVVSDPNPNVVLRLCRRIVGHVDPECPSELARKVLERAGFHVTRVAYDILFSLPLSGGYVGPVLFPPWPRLGRGALALESALVAALALVRLERYLCWRYFLVAERR